MGYRDQLCAPKTAFGAQPSLGHNVRLLWCDDSGRSRGDGHMLEGTYLLFSVMACVAQSTATASAQIAAFDERLIQAAVMLDGFAEPIVGQAHCRVDNKCEIISGAGSGVKVDVTWRRRGAVESADLTIQCPKDCSFTSGRSKITFQSERKFDLFRGQENDVEIRPVLRPRIKIGRIFLIVE